MARSTLLFGDVLAGHVAMPVCPVCGSNDGVGHVMRGYFCRHCDVEFRKAMRHNYWEAVRYDWDGYPRVVKRFQLEVRRACATQTARMH